VAAAAGGCVLVRRSALQRIGGFAPLRGEIIDDVALGRAIKAAGGRTWLGLDAGVASERSYEGLVGLWCMVSRTAFTQLGYRWSLLVVTLIALGIFLVSPPLAMGAAWIEAASGDGATLPSEIRAGIWAGLAWMLMTWSYLPAVRHHRVPVAWALTLPLAGLLFGLMTASSAIADWRGRGPSWRGRHYRSSRRSSASIEEESDSIDPVVR
jgi:hypothetical protein